MKNRLPQKHFSQHTPEAPDVDFLPVAVGAEEHLGCPVPPRGDVLSEDELLVRAMGEERPDEAKVTELNLAVLAEEDVGRLEVAVKEVGGVEVVDCVHNLEEDVVLVDLLEQVILDGCT